MKNHYNFNEGKSGERLRELHRQKLPANQDQEKQLTQSVQYNFHNCQNT